MGSGTGAARGRLRGVCVDARTGAPQARPNGETAAAAGTNARACGGEYAGGTRRDRLPDPPRPRAGGALRRVPGRCGTGAVRSRRAIQGLPGIGARTMNRKRYYQIGAAVAVIVLTAVVASRVLERMVSPVPQQSAAPAPAAP